MSGTTFDLTHFRARIAALAEKGIYVGTSSWKYEGWIGQIYTASRYEYRGRVASSRFERECLREYGETFRTVCVDAAFYAFPDEGRLRDMADEVPEGFRFAFKVTDEITTKRYPQIDRMGPRAGTVNDNFLNADLFASRFLQPMQAIRSKVGPIILEFGKFHPTEYETSAAFLAALDRFFSQLPKGWIFSVELRNRKWLGPDYLSCLRKHGVAHVFNNWTDMPPVVEQIDIVGESRIEHASVARFLLKPGRKYEEAVKKFSPYKITQEVNEEARKGIAVLIQRGWLKLSRDGNYIYINNRLEGNALLTVLAVLDRLHDLPLPVSVPAPPAEKQMPQAAQTQFDLGL